MVDAPTAPKTILDYLSQWSPVLLLLLGGLLTQLWNRFRTRMRRFTWKALHNRIAVAADDPHLGEVTVQHNGTPVNNVHLTTVEIENDSSEDRQDVNITLAFQDGSRILNSSGKIEEDIHGIPFEESYISLFQNATPELVATLSTYVIHHISVFNRHQKAVFNLLVLRDDARQPFVTVSCSHLGVKLEPKAVGPELDGVRLVLAIWVGVAVTLATVVLVVRYQRHPHPYLMPVFAWFIGVYCAKVGAAVVRVWRTLARALG